MSLGWRIPSRDAGERPFGRLQVPNRHLSPDGREGVHRSCDQTGMINLLQKEENMGRYLIEPPNTRRGVLDLIKLEAVVHDHSSSWELPDHSLFQDPPTCMPDAAPSVSRYRRSCSHDLLTTVVLTSSRFFSTRQWFTFVPLPRSHLTPVFLLGLFLRRSPPLPLGSSSGRWFESCSCKPVRGAPPHQPYSYAKPINQTAMLRFAHDAIRIEASRLIGRSAGRRSGRED